MAQAELQPHRSKYWLNTKEKDPEVFQQQVEIVCQTYVQAPQLYFQENTHTVSVDEMPGIQALERNSQKSSVPRRLLQRLVCRLGRWIPRQPTPHAGLLLRSHVLDIL